MARSMLAMACLACAVHGRRVHLAQKQGCGSAREAHKHPPETASTPPRKVAKPLHALAMVFATQRPDAGWRTTGVGQRSGWHSPRALPVRYSHVSMDAEAGTDVADPDVETEQRDDMIMSDDPMVIALEEECARMNGQEWRPEYGLQQLLNPSKVINLEKELVELRKEFEAATDGEKRTELQKKMNEKEKKKREEMGGVMMDWLKQLFVVQSLISVVFFGLIAYDVLPGFPDLPLLARIFGFWGIWLFTIPSLRSRKPGGFWGMSNEEKKALDISFLITPLVNVGLPFYTKDEPTLFWANIVTLAACYAYGFISPNEDGNQDASLPAPIKFALQALDYGSGQERGVRGVRKEKLQEQWREYNEQQGQLEKEEKEQKLK